MTEENRITDPILDERIRQLPERVKRALGSASVRSFAKKAGVSEGTLRNIMNGGVPRIDNLLRIAEAAGVDAAWLATGQGPMAPGDYQAQSASQALLVSEAGAEPDYTQVPPYDMRAASGQGSMARTGQVFDSFVVRKTFITRELHLDAKDLVQIRVEDESMEPTLRAGDVVLVDHRAAPSVPRDGIYALKLGDTLILKRLQRLPGRRIKATSDNPAYEAFELALDGTADDLAIVGRVVWSGGRM